MMVEGKIPMAARRQVTNKLRSVYVKAWKPDKARILDEVMSTTGMGRSTARRMLTGQLLPNRPNRLMSASCYRRLTATIHGRCWSMCGR